MITTATVKTNLTRTHKKRKKKKKKKSLISAHNQYFILRLMLRPFAHFFFAYDYLGTNNDLAWDLFGSCGIICSQSQDHMNNRGAKNSSGFFCNFLLKAFCKVELCAQKNNVGFFCNYWKPKCCTVETDLSVRNKISYVVESWCFWINL